MVANGSQRPTAFVSYSRDNDSHKVWVKEFSSRLRSDGIEIMLDAWYVAPNDNLFSLIEQSVRTSDFFIIVCTPRYKSESEKHIGVVGYEGDIISREVLEKSSQSKIIPVLRQGTWNESAPSWLPDRFYIDLSETPNSESAYEDLVQTLFEKYQKNYPSASPPITTPPIQSTSNDSFRPESPEWGSLNSRRAWLIHKKVNYGLSMEEEAEFDFLQKKFSDAVERLFPRRAPSPQTLALINQLLGSDAIGASKQ